MKTAYK